MKLAKQASLTSRTSLSSVSSLLTRVGAGLGSQPAAARCDQPSCPYCASHDCVASAFEREELRGHPLQTLQSYPDPLPPPESPSLSPSAKDTRNVLMEL